jgi:hypothetical protein
LRFGTRENHSWMVGNPEVIHKRASRTFGLRSTSQWGSPFPQADFWPGVVESLFRGVTSGLPVIRPASNDARGRRLEAQTIICRSEACQQKWSASRADIDPCLQICGTHFFKVVCQFSTTVKATGVFCATGTPMRKRLPSGVTSLPIKPGGSWNRALGAPA